MAGQTPEKFMKKVSRGMAKTELGDVTSLTLQDDYIEIMFERLGKSTIRYKLNKEAEDKFSIEFDSENIAFTHGMFRNQVENLLFKIMKTFGAVKG